MAEKKEKRYVSDNAQLMSEWDWKKNNELGYDPTKLTCGSGKKAWWICSKGHEWQAALCDRDNGRGCPYCSGRKVLAGYNDLTTINPDLVKEWNHEKNTDKSPCNFTASSNKKVWWICGKGHEWQASISNRNNGSGCPYCSNNDVLKGYNDLQTVNPTLASEWNYNKNSNLKPDQFTVNSGKKVWWICKEGHEWQAAIGSRNKGANCPYCFGIYPIKGVNDLQTINPTLAKEWNYEKNKGLTPTDVLPNSSKEIWWKCKKGHEWKSTVCNRNRGNGCPFCGSERNTSFPEYAIIYYFEKYGLNTLHSYKEKGYELDIYIPSHKIAIEYDGYYWHKNKTKIDLYKNVKCKEDGIKLYRIREGLLPLNDSSIDFVVDKKQKGLSKILSEILQEIIGITPNIDIERDIIEIENLREHTEKEASLMFSNNNLSKEWNYKKNGMLRPEYFAVNSGKKVWWICEKGHEWQATIASRNRGNGCPYCSSKKVLKDVNDLKTINPILTKEWNYEKNGELKPENIGANSHKKVWWKCRKGHEWEAMIVNRNKGYGCPYCSGRYAIKGENDLQSTNPDIAKEWDYEKNSELTPTDVLPGSSKKVWWKCNDCGNSYLTSIYNRTRGFRCPLCAKQNTKNKVY